jgi:hypothetical protein
MRFILAPLLILCLFISQCSEPDEPKALIVQTLEVTNSSSSSRIFRGLLEHVSETDTVIAYGFEWESRYGNWKAEKHAHLKQGNFDLRDHTPLSKWSSFTVRAFIETRNGVIYGDAEKFETEGK